nr:polysaccharide deacetylase family protein [Blautia sp. OF09-25XD]
MRSERQPQFFSLLRRRHLFLPFRCPSSPLLPKTGGSPSRKREDSRRNATSEELAAYNAWFAASPEENIIYLTFDCGYENGNTPAILDALQKHQAPAAFFVVGNFLSDQPDLVKRMAAEGHIVGNHTWSHPDMSKISTQEAFSEELNRVSALYQETTSQEMVKFYRPPQGKYSTQNLQMAKDLGYQTFFWSLAM